MSAVVVVTRNPALGMGLSHTGYDVTDVRPDRHGDWTREARMADAVVLELPDAVAAESAVLRLRAEGIGVPVLLVSNDSPGWETTADHVGAAAAVLPLPLTLTGLNAALERLIQAGPMTVPPPPANEEELLSAVAASIGMAISDSGTLVAHEGPPAMPRVRTPADLGAVPGEEGAAPGADEAGPPAEEAEGEPEPGAAAFKAQAPAGSPMDLVATLTRRAAELSGVADCAEAAVSELSDRIDAEAVVLLLPDGDTWRVAGGRGLRPLEHRAHLAGDHWLVSHVVTGGQALLADDTDGARDELIGAPLASRARVLAVPVPDVAGLLVAGRDGAAFTEEALRDAVAVAGEAAPLLREALAVRALARALAPFADLDDPYST